MLTQVLVPLDGSPEAESALAVSTSIAKRTSALVTLVRVLETQVVDASGQSPLVYERAAREYLSEIIGWLSDRGIRAGQLIRDAAPSVAATIAAVGTEVAADLLAFASRGHGRAQGAELGSIARELLVSGSVPFLLVRPFREHRYHQFACERLLLPLDGSERSLAALPAAHMLAEAFGGEILLMWVLPLAVPGGGASGIGGPADEETFAEQYLDATAQGLRWGGVTVDVQVARGEPVRVLLETAERRNADLIVLASHGRSSNPRVWAGSVTSRLVEQTQRRVMLVRSPR